ncbi:hypothetical protein [Pseudomonas shirazica]|uniref:hypothetical protein n=1 Tax=Pseudomonas shirazica TaxID=1940636 RepID=UPI00111ADAA7|nr:hypothetical protein [Pseudomonas shirazica]
MSISATITLQQLAGIIDRDPTLLARCRDDFPKAMPLRTGKNGRPQLCYSIEQVARYVHEKTAFLTDFECRIRLALGDSTLKPLFDEPVFDDDGRCLYMPPTASLGELTPKQRQQVRADIKQQAQVAADRAAARSKNRARPRRAESAN